MKKLLSLTICLTVILSTIAVTAVSTSAVDNEALGASDNEAAGYIDLADTAAPEIAEEGADIASDEELADVGAAVDMQSSGEITPVNLGDSFYARLKMIKYSDYYLTAPAKPTDTAILRTLNEYNSQVWHFTRDGSAYRIRNVANNSYLEMSGSEIKEGAYLFHDGTKSNSAAQKWYITKDTTGYRIHSAINDGYVMVCVSPTASTSRVVLTTAVTNARAYFSFDKLKITSDLLSTPMVKLSNHLNGVLVDWNDVTNATQYRVYRFNDSTKKWIALADVKKSNYIDTTAVSGTTYQYTVKTISPVLSKYSAKSIKYIAAPKAAVNNTADGPQIYWSKVNGAEKYSVFYHNGSQWKTLGTTTATSYLHKGFEYNKTYKYTVRCISADGKSYTSAYDTNGVSNMIVPTPEVKTSIMPFSCDLSWARIANAAKYRVFYKSKANGWKWVQAGDTAEPTYSFSDVVSNNGYYFTVRALDSKGKLISGFKSTALVTFYEAPCVFDITSSSGTRKISWYPIDGAEQYRVFAWNGQKWKAKGDTPYYTTSLSVPISGKAEENLCYAVRCMDKNGKFISYYLETVIESDLRYYYPGEYTSTHKF